MEEQEQGQARTPVEPGDVVVVQYVATGTYRATVGELGFENCHSAEDVVSEEQTNFDQDWEGVLAFLPDLALSVQLERVERKS